MTGTGWSTVVVSEVGGRPEEQWPGTAAGLPQPAAEGGRDWGSGRLLAGTAFSAVLTDDGRIAVGAVRPEKLYEALAR